MKKKGIIITVAVVLLVSVLVGVIVIRGSGTADAPQESAGPEVTASPDPEPAQTAEPAETPDPEDNPPINLSQQDQPEDAILSDAELLSLFRDVYDIYKGAPVSDEEKLDMELRHLPDQVTYIMPGKQLPEDYVERYIEWRPVDGGAQGDNNGSSQPGGGSGSGSGSGGGTQQGSGTQQGGGSGGQQGSGGSQQGSSPSGWIDDSKYGGFDPGDGEKIDPEFWNNGYDGVGWGSGGGAGKGVHGN